MIESSGPQFYAGGLLMIGLIVLFLRKLGLEIYHKIRSKN